MGENKKVLVTGSSRGIGREIALFLAKNGFDIDVHYAHNKEKAQEVADEIKSFGQNAEILKFDIKNREECAKVLADKLYYGIVLNAGIARDNVFPLLEGDEWDDVIQTNLTGFYNVLKPLVMPMISNRIRANYYNVVCFCSFRQQGTNKLCCIKSRYYRCNSFSCA